MNDLEKSPLLGYIKLCALFRSHQWIQTGVTGWKRSIQFKIGDFFILCDLVIWWMTLKIIGQLFYATSSVLHHFITIGQFKLELCSGNAKLWVKSDNFLSHVTLKFDRWHWKTIGNLFYATSNCVCHLIAICQFRLGLQSGNIKFGSKLAIF